MIYLLFIFFIFLLLTELWAFVLGPILILFLYCRLGPALYFAKQAKINSSFNLVDWAYFYSFPFFLQVWPSHFFFYFIFAGGPVILPITLLRSWMLVEIGSKSDEGFRSVLSFSI
jgi:hypothetical protein